MNRAAIWFSAAVGAIAIAASCQLDDIEDHQSDWSDSAELKALQASEAGTLRREKAAQALCTKAQGPNSEAMWTADGDLVCRTRRGVVRAAL
ncbi:hypothetical protein D9M73_116590 [compost metagenome]